MISRRSVLLAAPALILPRRILARSRRPPYIGGGGASGGGGGYVAQAVHFDGNTVIHNSGGLVGISNSPFGLLSTWIKATDFFNVTNGDDGLLIGCDGTVTVNIAGSSTPNELVFLMRNSATSNFAVNCNSAFGSSWLNLKLSWDTNHAAGSKIFQMYIGDAPFTDVTISDIYNAFSINYINGGPWWPLGTDFFPTIGPGPLGDVADYYFAPGQFLDLSVEANRRKFLDVNGKPVNLGADGSTPTGVAPSIFFSGDNSSFSTNLGTGGPFTLTGTLTNATTSPSD